MNEIKIGEHITVYEIVDAAVKGLLLAEVIETMPNLKGFNLDTPENRAEFERKKANIKDAVIERRRLFERIKELDKAIGFDHGLWTDEDDNTYYDLLDL